MARLINLATPECGVTDGMEISFRAPCNCSDVTGVTLDGKNYALVDASGESLTSCSDYFKKDAILTIIIDVANLKATLLNPRVNTFTKTLGTPEDPASAEGTTVWSRLKQAEIDIEDKAPASHTHTEIGELQSQLEDVVDGSVAVGKSIESDKSSVAETLVEIDNRTWIRANSSSEFEFTFDGTFLERGAYLIVARIDTFQYSSILYHRTGTAVCNMGVGTVTVSRNVISFEGFDEGTAIDYVELTRIM